MALNLKRLSKIANGKNSILNTEGRILDIELELIKPDPSQPRKEFNEGELLELSESIKEYGLLQPIVVRSEPDETFTIISGERRFRASQLLHAKSIKAIVNSSIAAENISYAQMAENMKRSSLTVEEVAEFICTRILAGEKQIEVAEKLALEKALVSKYSTWKDFPEEIRTAVKNKKVNSIQTAYILYKKWSEYPEEVTSFIENKASISKSEANSFIPKSCSGTTFSTDEDIDPVSSEGEEKVNEPDGKAEQVMPEEPNAKEEDCLTALNDGQEIPVENDPNEEGEPGHSDELDNPSEESESAEGFSFTEQNTTDDFLEEFAPEESPEEQYFSENQKSKEHFENNSEVLTEDVFKKPVIFCLVDGRECELLYRRKAADGLVFVKYEDGSESEVLAEKVLLNRICEE